VKEQLVNRTYRTRHAGGHTGWDPAPGWAQPHLPGWAPLIDHGPLPLRAAGSVVRWWWPILAVAGFLAVVVQVLDHDDPTPGLAGRGLLTIALAAVVVVLLTVHRSTGPLALARAVAEYTVVALLAALLATAGGTVDQQPANRAAGVGAQANATAGEDQPGVIRAGTAVVRAVTKVIRAVTGVAGWLADLWRQADAKTDRPSRSRSTTTPPTGEAMPPFPAVPPSTRRPT
jgi:hypothetical protein